MLLLRSSSDRKASPPSVQYKDEDICRIHVLIDSRLYPSTGGGQHVLPSERGELNPSSITEAPRFSSSICSLKARRSGARSPGEAMKTRISLDSRILIPSCPS